jgi:DNA-binding FadR family transcriptional regulator
MSEIALGSNLLNYLIAQGFRPGDRLPTITELQSSDHLGMSTSKVREELEVARALGLVDVRSKTGMRMRDYHFAPAVRFSLFYALALDLSHFELFSELRNHVEAAFWLEACQQLTDDDRLAMRACVENARAKLNGTPIRIPTQEHREFHMRVFRRLDNPFVTGILEAYWDAYEAVELNRYADYPYLQLVWDYHARILEALEAGDLETSRNLYIEHTRLIRHQPQMQRMSRDHHLPVQSSKSEEHS